MLVKDGGKVECPWRQPAQRMPLRQTQNRPQWFMATLDECQAAASRQIRSVRSKNSSLLNFLGEHRGEEHPVRSKRMLADIIGSVNKEPLQSR